MVKQVRVGTGEVCTKEYPGEEFLYKCNGGKGVY